MLISLFTYLRGAEAVIAKYSKVINQLFSVVQKLEHEKSRVLACDFLCKCTEQKRKDRRPCVMSVFITM